MNENKTKPDILNVQGRMTLGYGIVPKLPMQDRRLTIEAKAIYSYFCSYAGAGTTAFPSRKKILYDLDISEDRYYKHFNFLKQYGYINVTKNTDNKGKFANNIYTLVEMIDPYPQNKGTDNPYPQNPGTEKPCPENKGAKNNSDKINTLKNQQSESKSKSDQPAKLSAVVKKPDGTMTKTETIDKSARQPQQINFLEKKKEEKKKELTQTAIFSRSHSDGLQSSSNNKYSTEYYNSNLKLIQENIRYNDLTYNRKFYDIELIDELVNCMLDVICTKGDTVKINGEEKSRAMVRSQYLKINSRDIDHILIKYKEQHNKITHLHAYLKTMLYTVKQESGHYYANAVRADGIVW